MARERIARILPVAALRCEMLLRLVGKGGFLVPMALPTFPNLFPRQFLFVCWAITLLTRVAVADEPKTIAARLQPYVDSHVMAGAVTLVADKDKVLDVAAVGQADVAANKPMTPDALFWTASMTKPFTCTALMMLVDEGKLNVDDPVEKYLPEFKNLWVLAEKDDSHELLKKPVHPITIRNIMSHTSGLDSRTPVEQPTADALSLAVRVPSYPMLPLKFQPDSDYFYSNEGMNTVGRIIEIESGQPYAEFIEQRILQPLGMKDTTFWPTEAQVARLARSYKANKDKSDIEEVPIAAFRYPLTDRTRNALPAGGLFSTAADLAKFCQMMLNGGELGGHRYLSPASLAAMTTRQIAPELKTSYGFGLMLGNDHTFGHGGAYSTNMTIDPQHGLVTIFLVQNAGWRNSEGPKIEPAFRKAAVELFAK
jgi:CubicO group peptidase (beta-lactamase class C family)